MNELQIFKNEEFGEVRTVIVDDEPWFVAADVCRALELGNPSQAISRLDDDEVTLTTNEGHSGKLGGPQKMNIVSEAGLYSLILKSRKPEAKRFKRWITHEVIPTIRKTGGYVNDESTFIATYLPFADEGTKALFAQTLGALRSANQKIEADKPKVLFADAVSTSKSSILIGDLAKILKQNGMDIGRHIDLISLLNLTSTNLSSCGHYQKVSVVQTLPECRQQHTINLMHRIQISLTKLSISSIGSIVK